MSHVVICPTITAFTVDEYKQQVERVQPFAQRLHIDLMDGEFAPTVSPGLETAWWPPEITADIHVMYQRPMESLAQLVHLKPHMVIIHAEAEVDHGEFANLLHSRDIKVGLALLQDTAVESVLQMIQSFDQVLVFSGDLGKHGGLADLTLLDKVVAIREEHPSIEIAWDGGIDAANAAQLVAGGVTVLNVGGAIQKSDTPAESYNAIRDSIA